MSLPKFSPKRLKEIAEGLRYRDGTLKVNLASYISRPKTMADILKANKDITTANKLVGKPKIRKKITARSKNNKGGQVALFKRIWGEREHKCEVCGAHIEEATASTFSHILGKGAYPSMKLDERNVEIWCSGGDGCHDEWHREGGPRGVMKYPKWLRVCSKAIQLRNEVNNVNQ